MPNFPAQAFSPWVSRKSRAGPATAAIRIPSAWAIRRILRRSRSRGETYTKGTKWSRKKHKNYFSCAFFCDFHCAFCDSFPFRLVPQRERVNRVIALWIDSGLGKQICSDRPQAGHDRDVLPSIDAIGDRAVLNRSSKRRFPEDLSRVGIERAKLLIQISPEHDIPGRY